VPDVIANTFKLFADGHPADHAGRRAHLLHHRAPRIALSGLLDSVLMVPYVVPGVVMAIGFLLTFNSGAFDLVGTASIIVLILFIRRLPYGVRATSAVLRQIKPSIEEAAISLGASPAEGVSQGHRAADVARHRGRRHDEFHHRHQRAVVHAAALHRRAPPPCRSVYSAVLDGEFGIAAALSTILLVSSGLCVYVVMRFSQSKESAFV
jgi:iron(III) transport system permease protein